MLKEMYTSGEYLAKWPTWHIERSPWSAKQILRMMARNHLIPTTICEVGCGAGEVLRQLQLQMNNTCEFSGYEISPQAFEICQSRVNERLHFKLADFTQEQDVFFDLALVIDVLEHVEDYLSFLRAIKPKSDYKILHIPLDLSVNVILRNTLNIMLKDHGHVHYFTGNVALQVMEETGYEVLDYFYTAPAIDLPTDGTSNETRRKVIHLFRKLLFALNPDMAARILGGYSLMVLAR
jgi:SAM-dependent methyltransferase